MKLNPVLLVVGAFCCSALSYGQSPPQTDLCPPHVLSSELVALSSKQVQPLAPAPGTLWSAAWYFDLRHKTSASVAAYKVKTFTNVFGNKNISVDLSTFAGYDLNDSSFVSGWELGKSFQVATGVYFTIGLAISVETNHPIGGGGIFGLAVQF